MSTNILQGTLSRAHYQRIMQNIKHRRQVPLGARFTLLDGSVGAGHTIQEAAKWLRTSPHNLKLFLREREDLYMAGRRRRKARKQYIKFP
jgi:hypothetical protein